MAKITLLTSLQNATMGTVTEPLDLAQTISLAGQRYSQALQAKGLTITTDLHVTSLNQDPLLISFVLDGLLNNAIKFTPVGKKVELFMRREARGIAAYVKDAGIGIHPSETKKIFAKFYQAKYQKDEKLRKQGWGLGLSIANEIIHSHNGEIGATSPGLGKGSTFWFRVPAGA